MGSQRVGQDWATFTFTLYKLVHFNPVLFLFRLCSFGSVQLLSCVQLFATPWTVAHKASLSITNSQSLPKPMSNQSVLHNRWPKYWSFSFSICPSNDYSGLISFRMDWLDLLAVQGTQESSATPQFKSVSSLVLSFLYSPTLTSIHDFWKNHSFV